LLFQLAQFAALTLELLSPISGFVQFAGSARGRPRRSAVYLASRRDGETAAKRVDLGQPGGRLEEGKQAAFGEEIGSRPTGTNWPNLAPWPNADL